MKHPLPRRLLTATVCALALLLVTAAALPLSRRVHRLAVPHLAVRTAAPLAATAAAIRCPVPATSPHARPGTPVLFVGASYTAGLGASVRGDGFAPRAAAALGRPYRVDAISGSGYVATGGRPGGDFVTRMGHVEPGPAPGLVVLQGGRNDAGYPVARLREAAVTTVVEVRRDYPQATVALLGPVPGSLPVAPSVVAVGQVLSRVAAACHVHYVDALGEQWITRTDLAGYAGHVRGHPNDAGYAYIAHRLVVDLGPTEAATPPGPAGRPGTGPDGGAVVVGVSDH